MWGAIAHCAANVTVTAEVTFDGTRQVWRLRVPTRLRSPFASRLKTPVRTVPH
jgi:hypothetical protein